MGSLPPVLSLAHPADTSATPPAGASADHSRFVQRIRRRYAAELALLAPGRPDRECISALIALLQSTGQFSETVDTSGGKA